MWTNNFFVNESPPAHHHPLISISIATVREVQMRTTPNYRKELLSLMWLQEARLTSKTDPVLIDGTGSLHGFSQRHVTVRAALYMLINRIH